MRKSVGPIVRVLTAMCLLVCAAGLAAAQDEDDLTARQRIFPGVGPGLRAVKRGGDGRLYILASPSPGLLVFDTQGKQVLSIGELPGADTGAKSGRPLITFGEDCDGAADGKIYVADRGANLIQVFSSDGAPIRSIPVNAPVAVAALPESEVAVATLRDPHLVIVFDKNGRDVREFGDPEPLAERAELNRYLNIGQLATDAQGHLYYAFATLPNRPGRNNTTWASPPRKISSTRWKPIRPLQPAGRETCRRERRGRNPPYSGFTTRVGVDRDSSASWISLTRS